MIRKKIMISGFCVCSGDDAWSCKPGQAGRKIFLMHLLRLWWQTCGLLEEIKVPAKHDESPSGQDKLESGQPGSLLHVVCRRDNDGSEWKKLKELTSGQNLLWMIRLPWEWIIIIRLRRRVSTARRPVCFYDKQ